jgi:hypothetical protein
MGIDVVFVEVLLLLRASRPTARLNTVEIILVGPSITGVERGQSSAGIRMHNKFNSHSKGQ